MCCSWACELGMLVLVLVLAIPWPQILTNSTTVMQTHDMRVNTRLGAALD